MKWNSEALYDRSKVNKEILTELINLFVIKEKRLRFLEFIDSPKRYEDFLDELLNDPRNLRSECIIELSSDEQTVKTLLKKLYKLGAGKKAYLVSNNDEIDGKIGSLEETLPFVYGEGFVYCLDSRLAYYEGHENWRYILQVV